jgi:hypothetical protein
MAPVVIHSYMVDDAHSIEAGPPTLRPVVFMRGSSLHLDLDHVTFLKLLLTRQVPVRHWVKPNPLVIPRYSGAANKLVILRADRWVRLNCDHQTQLARFAHYISRKYAPP